jgi:hypothetical protein
MNPSREAPRWGSRRFRGRAGRCQGMAGGAAPGQGWTGRAKTRAGGASGATLGRGSAGAGQAKTRASRPSTSAS